MSVKLLILVVCIRTIVIKPELARWVDPVAGPIRVRWKTGKSKKIVKLDRSAGSTCDPGNPVKPDRELFLLCFFPSQRPFFYIFFSWLLTLFKVHYINTRRTFYFFQCVIWNPLVYILYVHKKKVIFLIWDLKLFNIYTLCSQEKKLCFFNVG
jgi:hypothetical protein